MIYLQYIVSILVASAVITLLLLINKKKNEKLNYVLKIVSLVLAGVFFFQFMLGHDALQNIAGLSGGNLNNKALNFFALILNWFYFAVILLVILYPFFKKGRYTAVLKFFGTIASILMLGFMTVICKANLGADVYSYFNVRAFLFGICVGILVGYSISIFIIENKFKMEKSDAWGFVYLLFMLIATMPSYMLNALFGTCRITTIIDDFSITHRWVLYMAFVIPILLFVLLRKKDPEENRGILLYICLGTLISFSLNYKFIDFKDITHLPFHLCHTAMYILPLCLIFKMKRLFYFTYFINVFGAFIAMALPDYAVSYNLFNPVIVKFYINHFMAFFMPLLIVACGVFERPRMKQFLYSCLGFAAYFVLILIANAWFTNYNPSVDYFYINGDYIVSKLGNWAEDTRDFVVSFNIGSLKFVFYPLYQALFFVVYIFVSLGMWFIYEGGYAFVDTATDLVDRKRKIRMDQLALEVSKGENINMLEENREVSLVLDNFSKRYGSSKRFAVKDASLEVRGGEVYGFLGHNGAGKSTIIKSIVGIQPITSGSIRVCGYDVEKEPIEAKRLIGFVPDQYALYEKLTGREYVNYIADLYEVPNEERQERIEHYVSLFDLKDAFDNQIKTYSHGMKQKVTIISALVHDPKVWILDEPLTGLDPTSIYQVKQCMKQHAEAGNIVFFSSHLIDIVKQICTRVAIIKKGHILYSDSVENIEKTEGLENFYLRLTQTSIDDLEKPEEKAENADKKEEKKAKKEKKWAEKKEKKEKAKEEKALKPTKAERDKAIKDKRAKERRAKERELSEGKRK